MKTTSINIQGAEQVIVLNNIAYISGPIPANNVHGNPESPYIVIHFIAGETLSVPFDDYASAKSTLDVLENQINDN